MMSKNFKSIMIGLLLSLNIIFIGIYYKMDSDTSENARKDAIVIDRVKNDALDALNEIERAKNNATKNASESKSASDTAIEFAREAEVASQNAR
jgi:septal ring-binding cell division protein DamX